jgi:CRP/FNR family transcriptional regulator, cyclic AMP receptor protein
MIEVWLDFDILARAGFPLVRHGAGERIFVEGDDGRCMYVVRSGQVSITKHGMVLERVGPNGIFGEMALIDGSPRSATATAVEPTEIAPIDKSAFDHLVRRNPDFALRVMRLLVDRLRQTNANL